MRFASLKNSRQFATADISLSGLVGLIFPRTL